MSDCISSSEMTLLKYFVLEVLITELKILKKNIDCSDFDNLMSVSEIDKQLQHFDELQDGLIEEIASTDKFLRVIMTYTRRFILKKGDEGYYFTLYNHNNKDDMQRFENLSEMIDFLKTKDVDRINKNNIFKVIK